MYEDIYPTQGRRQGGGRGKYPPPPMSLPLVFVLFVCLFLLVSSITYEMMIIPLPHYGHFAILPP